MEVQGKAQRAPDHSKHSPPVGIQCGSKAGNKLVFAKKLQGSDEVHGKSCKELCSLESSANRHKNKLTQARDYFQSMGKKRKTRWLRKWASRRELKRSYIQNDLFKDELEGQWCSNLRLRSKISWKEHLLVATWNVRTLMTRQHQQLMFADLHKLKISVAALQEVR